MKVQVLKAGDYSLTAEVVRVKAMEDMFNLKFKNLKLKENALRYFFLGITLLMLIFLQLYALPLIIIWYVMLSGISHLVGAK